MRLHLPAIVLACFLLCVPLLATPALAGSETRGYTATRASWAALAVDPLTQPPLAFADATVAHADDLASDRVPMAVCGEGEGRVLCRDLVCTRVLSLGVDFVVERMTVQVAALHVGPELATCHATTGTITAT